jgi:hypothetical protein
MARKSLEQLKAEVALYDFVIKGFIVQRDKNKEKIAKLEAKKKPTAKLINRKPKAKVTEPAKASPKSRAKAVEPPKASPKPRKAKQEK